MQDLIPYYSAIPAIGAVLLSLYNWYTLRQGGKVQPLPIINFGLWSVSRDQRKVKHLFLPIILDNVAIKPALVTDIKISFSQGSDRKFLNVNRRIELDMPTGSMSGMGINNFRANHTKELVPFYPISISGQEGRMVMLDCLDRGEILDLDKSYDCFIEITYGNYKKSSVSFPFKISSSDFEKGLDNIIWLKL